MREQASSVNEPFGKVHHFEILNNEKSIIKHQSEVEEQNGRFQEERPVKISSPERIASNVIERHNKMRQQERKGGSTGQFGGEAPPGS